MHSKHFSLAWIWQSLKIPVIAARNGVTVNNHSYEVKSVARCRRWCRSLWRQAKHFLFLVCLGLCRGLKLFLCAGPEPSDTGSTTEKPWEASSPRSETSTWFIISGVWCKMRCHADDHTGSFSSGLLDSRDQIVLCAFETTRLAPTSHLQSGWLATKREIP